MGMAASQVRFLSLQSRKNTIGLNLMTLSNRKLALSRDMNRVAAEYNDAMNQKILKWSGDSGITYQGLNYNLLMKPNENNATLPYIITDAQGRVVVDDTNIELDGVDTGVSYRDLAMMISAYSGYSEDDQKTHYMNYANDQTNGYVDNLTGADTGVTEDAIRNIGDNSGTAGVADANKATAGAANENGYEIVSTANQLASNSLRYDLMEKLGLIDRTEIDQIEDLEIELYGPSKNPNADKFPIGTLMGNYYLACANLEAYKNFLEDGDFKFAIGTTAPNAGTEDTKNSITDTNNPAFEADKITNSNDGTGQIYYVNNYRPQGTDIYFNAQSSYINKVDLTQKYVEGQKDPVAITTENGTIFTNENSSFKYTISNGNIQYDFATNSLLDLMGNTNLDKEACTTSSYGSAVNIKDVKWSEAINKNYTLKICYEVNDTECEDSKMRNAVTDLVNSMGNAISGITAVVIDSTALEKAKKSTVAFCMGDITNNGNHNRHAIKAIKRPNKTQDESISDSKNTNLVAEVYKTWAFTRAGHTASISIRNVYNTLMTFYDYYKHVPTAEAITDGSGITFSTGTTAGPTDEADSFATSEELGEMTPGADATFTDSSGQSYIRKKYTIEDTDEEGNWYKSTVYQYFKDNGSGATGELVQEDRITEVRLAGESTTEKSIDRITKQNDGTLKYYSGTNFDENTIGKTIGGGSTWVETSASGASGGVSNHVLDLIYTDEFGKEVHLKLANSVADSVYATTVSGMPNEEEAKENIKKLQAAVDEAAKAKDDAKSQLDKLFAEKESKIMDYFDSVFKMIAENGWVYDENVNSDDKEESKNYLNAMLQNNMYFVTEVDTLDGTDFNYATKLATNVSKIFEVYDEDAQNQALSKYEAEKAEINSKEKQVDIRMNKLETEQDAIKTELDSLKKIIDDNVQATFKIFT